MKSIHQLYEDYLAALSIKLPEDQKRVYKRAFFAGYLQAMTDFYDSVENQSLEADSLKRLDELKEFTTEQARLDYREMWIAAMGLN